MKLNRVKRKLYNLSYDLSIYKMVKVISKMCRVIILLYM